MEFWDWATDTYIMQTHCYLVCTRVCVCARVRTHTRVSAHMWGGGGALITVLHSALMII